MKDKGRKKMCIKKEKKGGSYCTDAAIAVLRAVPTA